MKILVMSFALSLIVAVTNPVCAQEPPPDSAKGSVHVHVTGFKHEKGTVKIALVNSRESYDSNTNIFRGAKENIVNMEVHFTFEDVPFGVYALKVFHDENDNDDLDTNFLGAPKEPYGFSNNVRGKFGPPDFEKVMFELAQAEMTMEIEVK
jgi:uncharacterized protein (DUF2141 family)